MITIHHLHKSFGKNKVLKGIDLTFEKPGITAVLGPNGSGKTTLIKSILGMVLPQEGSIEVFNQNIRGAWKYRERIAYLPQIARFPDNLRVKELIAMVKDLHGGNASEAGLVSLFELQPYLDKRLGNLSGGTRQKVNLVLAFMYDCPIIILDEPTAGLDPISLVRLKELIEIQRKAGKTILITTHVMSLVEELADEVVYLLDGQIHFRGSLGVLKETYGETSVERAIAALLGQEKKFDFGFRISDFGISDFGFRISGFRISDFGFRISGFRGFGISGFRGFGKGLRFDKILINKFLSKLQINLKSKIIQS